MWTEAFVELGCVVVLQTSFLVHDTSSFSFNNGSSSPEQEGAHFIHHLLQQLQGELQTPDTLVRAITKTVVGS